MVPPQKVIRERHSAPNASNDNFSTGNVRKFHRKKQNYVHGAIENRKFDFPHTDFLFIRVKEKTHD